MKSFNLKIPSTEPEEDLSIIYKEGKKEIREFKVISNEFFKSLRFFQKKRHEIEETKLICISEDINSEIFSNFITSIRTKEININDDNYQQYYYLSNKYEYTEMKKQIELFIEERPDVISIVKEISIRPNNQKEEIVSKNLDIAIKSGILDNVDLDIIIRIVNSPKRVIKDHHLLFNFIVNLIQNSAKNETKKVNKELLLILPSALDYSLMNEEEIEELIKVEGDNNDEFFCPSKANEKMQFFISKSKKDDQIKTEFESKIKSLESKFEELEKKFHDELTNLHNQISKLEENDKLKDKQQKQKINQMSNQIETMTQENTKRYSEEQKMHNQTQQSIANLQQRFDVFEKEFTIMKNKLEDTQNKNHDQEQKIEILERKIKNDEEKKKKEEDQIVNVIYDNNINKGLNGIISHMGNPKNLLDNGVVSVTASSVYNTNNHLQPKNVLDYNDAHMCFASKDEPNSWLFVDFHNYRVKPSHYSIQSQGDGGKGICHPQTWEISGSNDGSSWTRLDSRNNDKSLTVTFEIQYKNSEFYRYLKIMNKGVNTKSSPFDTNVLYFSSIEFFGSYKKL